MSHKENSPALVLDNVTRIHQDGNIKITALKDVSVTVNRGELVAIMGPSGSGKSTLLHIAGTLETPTKGTVTIDGINTAHMTAEKQAQLRRQHIGFVFQNYNLIDTLTVVENVALPLELDGISRSESREKALHALNDLGLGELSDRFPAEVSGGQRQRVAIARALVGERHIILADEPTGALDTTTAEAVMTVIRDQVNAGVAALVVTHEPRFAAWADRVIYLRDGKLHTHPDTAFAVPVVSRHVGDSHTQGDDES